MNLKDYKQPFHAIRDFEQAVAKYTGAPYCIATDSCTHAIEMVFRAQPPKSEIKFTGITYLSVLMTMHKLDIEYELTDQTWEGEYLFEGTNVFDSARRFEKDMYKKGHVQCCSFGRTKPLEIGKGGCVLTDDADLAQAVYEMRYDGRQLYEYDRWPDQKVFRVGYHYYMKPEDAIIGLTKLANHDFVKQKPEFYNYPDCRNIQIV